MCRNRLDAQVSTRAIRMRACETGIYTFVLDCLFLVV